jgi:hypothetical protein
MTSTLSSFAIICFACKYAYGSALLGRLVLYITRMIPHTQSLAEKSLIF